jgi:adenine-specific DNA-methyltransferase
VTTQTLSREHLAALSEEVGEGRTLLVYCMAFRGKATVFANLTLKKIPNAVLHSCEWGRDDYSLQVTALPAAPEPPPVEPRHDGQPRRQRPVEALPLFEARE